MIIKNLWKEIIADLKDKNKKISLIPTMGNLHKGHLELFDNAPDDSIKDSNYLCKSSSIQ